MDFGNMRLQEGIFLDRSVLKIGVKGISECVGATFVAHYLDRSLNDRGKLKVFVSRPDRYAVTDNSFEYDEQDVIVGVIDPLPSRLMEGAEVIEELLNSGTPVIWLLNRDNPGVNRRLMKKYLCFTPEFSQEEIPREMLCRAEYNCVELDELSGLEGIEKLAEHIKALFKDRLSGGR